MSLPIPLKIRHVVDLTLSRVSGSTYDGASVFIRGLVAEKARLPVYSATRTVGRGI